MRMTFRLLPIVALLSACAWTETGKPAPNSAILGNWRGESICTVRPSACNDEIAYYVVKPVAGKPARLSIDGNRIVDGKPVSMGILECDYDVAKQTATCAMKNGTWILAVNGDDMRGTLTHPDGTLYRRVHLTREK